MEWARVKSEMPVKCHEIMAWGDTVKLRVIKMEEKEDTFTTEPQ